MSYKKLFFQTVIIAVWFTFGNNKETNRQITNKQTSVQRWKHNLRRSEEEIAGIVIYGALVPF